MWITVVPLLLLLLGSVIGNVAMANTQTPIATSACDPRNVQSEDRTTATPPGAIECISGTCDAVVAAAKWNWTAVTMRHSNSTVTRADKKATTETGNNWTVPAAPVLGKPSSLSTHWTMDSAKSDAVVLNVFNNDTVHDEAGARSCG